VRPMSDVEIQPSPNNSSGPALLVLNPEGMLHMSIYYSAVNAIMVNNQHPLCLIEDLLDSRHGSCSIKQLVLATGYQ